MWRLGNLIAHLPSESSILDTIPSPHTADERRWNRMEQLLALLLETTDAAAKLQIKLWAKSPPKMKPLRIEWPGRDDQSATPKPEPSSPSEIAAFMGSRKGTIQVIGGNDDGS